MVNTVICDRVRLSNSRYDQTTVSAQTGTEPISSKILEQSPSIGPIGPRRPGKVPFAKLGNIINRAQVSSTMILLRNVDIFKIALDCLLKCLDPEKKLYSDIALYSYIVGD